MKISAFGIYYLILLAAFGLLCGGLLLAARFGKSSDQSPKSSTARPENELRWHPALCVFFSAVFLGAIPFIVADMDSKKNEALGYTSILVIISFAIGCLWAAFVIAKANRKAWREFQEKGPDTQE